MLRPSIFDDSLMDDMFHSMFYVPFGMKDEQMDKMAPMNADIKENDKEYLLDMELPGFSKEEIKAELKEGYLTINASHSEDKEEKDKDNKVIRKECYSGTYQRNFYVGDAVTKEDIKANFQNGVLSLSIPKKEAKEEIPQAEYIAIEG